MISKEDITQRLKKAMADGMKIGKFQDVLKAEGIHLTYLELRTMAAECQATPPNPEFLPTPQLPPDPLIAIAPHPKPMKGSIASGSFKGSSGSRGEWMVSPDLKVQVGGTIGSTKPTQEEVKELMSQINIHLANRARPQ